MDEFIIREIAQNNILTELHNIGFDEGYRFVAQNKYKYKNIKIFNLTPAQANILKQTALVFGADCAVHRDVISGNIEHSDAIIGGSYSQLIKIADKLKQQPFKLPILAEIITKNIQDGNRKTRLVGILNVTPDSFSDGGLYYKPDAAIKQFEQLVEDGADMIDIGAESTRPYSEPVPSEEQIVRLKPILDFIQKEKIQIPISVDTRCSKTADFALDNGVSIINDVSGFDYDSKMPNIIAKHKANVIIQHSKGNPDTMQDSPAYKNLIDEIYLSLKQKIDLSKDKGIKNITIDPGIGFGKTKKDNFQILNNIESFYSLNCPIMLGISRKSFLGIKNNDNNLKDILTLAISYPLIDKVDFLRVHNVKLHKHVLDVRKNS